MKKKLILLCFVVILFIILENKCYAVISFYDNPIEKLFLKFDEAEERTSMKDKIISAFGGDEDNKNFFDRINGDAMYKKFVVNATLNKSNNEKKMTLNNYMPIYIFYEGNYHEEIPDDYWNQFDYLLEEGDTSVRVLLEISDTYEEDGSRYVEMQEIHLQSEDDDNRWGNMQQWFCESETGPGMLKTDSGKVVDERLEDAPLKKVMDAFETFAILKAKLESILGYWEQMIESFEKRPIPTVLNYVFINGIRFIFDGLQLGMNFLQMHYLDTGMDFSLLYNYDLLVEDSGASNNGEQDKGQGHRDLYSKVSEYSDSKKEWQIKTNIESIDDDGNDWGFTMGTQIPVVSVDLYNMALNNIDYFDINFFNPNRIKERGMIGHKEDGGWIRFKKIVELAIRLLIYISAILMLFLLVWNGIKITSKVITDPRQKAKAQNNFTNILISTFLLVGVVVYMALCINISDWMWDISNNAGRDPYEGFIRVNVTNEGEGVYSFSTTFTGFVRYLLQTENLDILHIKVLILALYVIIVIVNIVMFLFMCMRTLMIVWLAIIGIINTLKISLNMYTSKDVTWKSDYIKWARDFFIYSSVHLVLIIVLNGIIAFNKV